MGDILTPKRQTVVDRLRRRIEFYRGHQESCYPRYENTCGGFYDQQRQETQILRQRFLESKAKKSKKEHRNVKDSSLTSDGQRGLIGQQKFSKRALDTSNVSVDVSSGPSDEHEHKPKISRTCKSPDQTASAEKAGPKDFQSQQQQQQQQQQSNIPNFSSQMLMPNAYTPMGTQVQHGKDLQASAASDDANKASKADSITVGSMCLPSKGPDVLPNASISPLDNIVCKQERETDLNQCSSAISSGTVSTVTTDVTCSTLSGASERFTDALSNLGFPDDSTDVDINVDILNDFLDGVDVLSASSEFMKGFSFDDSVTSDKDDKDAASIIDSECRKPADASGGQQNFTSTSLHSSYLSLSLSPPQSQSVFDTTLSTSNVTSNIPTSAGFDQTQLGNYGGPSANLNMGQNVGFDFKLKDPSPAAQTLKQLAEQHQNMQQKQQMHLGAANAQTHFNVDTFGSSLPSLHVNFLNGTNASSANLCQKNPPGDLFSADVFKQSTFDALPQSDLFKQESLTPSFLGGSTVNGIAQPSDLNIRPELSTHLPARRGGRGQMSTAKSLYSVDLDQKPCVANNQTFHNSRSSPHIPDQVAVSHTTISTTHVSSSLPPNHFMGARASSIRASSPQFQGVKQPATGHVLHVDTNQFQMATGKHKVQPSQGKPLEIAQALKQQSATNLPQNSVFRGYNCAPNSSLDFQVSSSQTQSVSFQSQCSSSIVTTASLLTVSDALDNSQLTKHRISQQHNDDMFFLTCPPPEYKPQMPSVSQVGTSMGNNLPMVLSSNQPFMQGAGLQKTYADSATNQSLSHQLSNKQITTSLSQTTAHPHHLTANSLNQAMGSTLPSYSQASQMNALSSQGLGSLSQPSMATTKPLYTNALSHEQRAPPNVNIGPEGLNIAQHNSMMGLDWKHAIAAQQQANNRQCPPLSSAQPKMQPRFQRGLQQQQQQHANYGQNALPTNTTGPRQITPRNFLTQQSVVGAADGTNPASSHVSAQMMSQQQMTARNGTLSMHMAPQPSVNMRNNGPSSLLDHNAIYHQSNPASTNTMQDSANISLDYLNGIDSSANLMNFDQVMQGNGAFTLLDDMGSVLGK